MTTAHVAGALQLGHRLRHRLCAHPETHRERGDGGVAGQEPLHHVAVRVAHVVEARGRELLAHPTGDAARHRQAEEADVGGGIDGTRLGPWTETTQPWLCIVVNHG